VNKRRPFALVLVALALAMGACNLDLIDPDLRARPASMSFTIDAREQPTTGVRVTAFLMPGVREDQVERQVHSRLWEVNGARISPDSSYASGVLELRWDTVLAAGGAPSQVWQVGFPTVEAATTPPTVLVNLSQGSGRTSGSWVVGETLVLTVGGVGSEARSWNLLVEGWRGTANPVPLWNTNTLGAVPQEVEIPSSWLPDSGFDSLRAAVTYNSVLTSSAPDSTYFANGLLRQRLQWVLSVVEP